MAFLILGALFIFIGILIDTPKTNISSIGLGLIVTYIVLHYFPIQG